VIGKVDFTIDPVRLIEQQRHGDEHTPQSRHQEQALLEQSDDPFEGQRATRSARLEQAQSRPVAVDVVRLHGEECRVVTAQFPYGTTFWCIDLSDGRIRSPHREGLVLD
jgi:hypothetical protein